MDFFMIRWTIDRYEMIDEGMGKIRKPDKYIKKILRYKFDILEYKKLRESQRRAMMSWEMHLELREVLKEFRTNN